MVGTVLRILALTVGATRFVAASPALVTLAAPFPASTAFSTDIVGVDSQGRTTYVVHEGNTEVVTATLVQGSDHAFFTLSHINAADTLITGYDCALNGGNAICSDVDPVSSKPITTTVFAVSIILDVAATTAAPSGTGGSSSSAPQPSEKPGSAQKTSASIFGVAVGLALLAYHL
ncbi:hypothetical protein B0H14DRAFT_3479594 [Mycena olivaceomarginata]|nr:hypothetical protein B0H14DRAFT_3479594 [Mycena olivaceomarginata]